MSFIKKIILFFMFLEKRFLENNLKKTLSVKNSSKSKKIFQNGCTLSLETLANSEKQRVEEEIELILKTYNYSPIEILEYIKKHNTDIFYIKNANQLHSIGENEGFIYPQTGAKALYLSLLTTKKFNLKTNAMFILTNGEINKYYFIYHFYNWYTYSHNIAGIDADSLAMLNKYLFNSNEEDFNKLQLSDIYKLKEAIKQDKSAIEFVFRLCQKQEGYQKALDKLKNNGANL